MGKVIGPNGAHQDVGKVPYACFLAIHIMQKRLQHSDSMLGPPDNLSQHPIHSDLSRKDKEQKDRRWQQSEQGRSHVFIIPAVLESFHLLQGAAWLILWLLGISVSLA
jgi:hypothetical protein